MNAKLPMLLVFLAATGCSAASSPARSSGAAGPDSGAAKTSAAAPAAEPADAPLPPAEALAQADLAYESQLGATRGQFSVDRQVTVLRQAVALYGQFLERADGRPELEPAVRKSRERIEDAEATIAFLLGHMKDAQGEPPPASTE